MKEEEIRPRQVFDEYLHLAALDADLYFNNSDRQAIPCPACLTAGKKVFEKHGFDYEVCQSATPSGRFLRLLPKVSVCRLFRHRLLQGDRRGEA